MPDTVEIGLGRSARRGYHLDEIALVPTRRTRGSGVVSTAWQIDAHTFDLPVLAAGVDLLVILGTVISAEHVMRNDEAGLNLKTFIAELDIPVIVGGVTNYQTALHLMRTGAAGVVIGYGAHLGSTTHRMLGI